MTSMKEIKGTKKDAKLSWIGVMWKDAQTDVILTITINIKI